MSPKNDPVPPTPTSGLVVLLKRFFGTFGVPREISSDRGAEFIANKTEDFLERWGVKMRDSAAYNPQSNGRAELGSEIDKTTSGREHWI